MRLAVRGRHADFLLLGVRGQGSRHDCARVEREFSSDSESTAESEEESSIVDVVMIQLCPTRLALSQFKRHRRISGRSWCGGLLLRWLWAHLNDRAAFLLPPESNPPRTPSRIKPPWLLPIGIGDRVSMAAELGLAVVLAANRDARVVLGDRDLLRTIGRIFDRLGVVDRCLLFLELGLCMILPIFITSHLFGFRREKPNPLAIIEMEDGTGDEAEVLDFSDGSRDDENNDTINASGVDAMTALLLHFERRFPRLATSDWPDLGNDPLPGKDPSEERHYERLVTEHEEYVLGSLERLDASLTTLCPHQRGCSGNLRRPRILAILGAGTLAAIADEFVESVGDEKATTIADRVHGANDAVSCAERGISQRPSRCSDDQRRPQQKQLAGGRKRKERRREAWRRESNSDSSTTGGIVHYLQTWEDRRRIGKAGRRAMRMGVFVPFFMATALLGIPLIYLASLLHNHVSPHIATLVSVATTTSSNADEPWAGKRNEPQLKMIE